MPHSKSSKKWLKEHFDDVYVKKSQAEGYRSRAVYKLQEIDDKENLIANAKTIVDLGAAPGGWSQYVAKKAAKTTKIYALDILPMEPLEGVEFIKGDFLDDEILKKLTNLLPDSGVDLVLSDMAPNMSGNKAIDIPRAMYLIECALSFAKEMLNTNGALCMKVFHGEGFDELVRNIRQDFERVVVKKPKASRSRSRETYLLAKGYKL